MKKRDISLDEVAFDSWAEEDYRRLETPLSDSVFQLSVIVVLIVGAIVFGRVLFLNISQGAFYQARAIANVNKEVKIPANRGIIMDRFGEPLVKNVPTFSATINASELLKNPGVLEEKLNETAAILNKSSEEIKNEIQQADLKAGGEVIIAHNITLDQAINLRSLKISALEVRDDYRRQYLDSPAFAHLLGYVGVAEKGDAIVGKTGLEVVYDSQLRGVDGRYIFYRDVQGEILEEKLAQKSRAGYQLNTTIDADLQRFFYQRFKQHLGQLNRDSGVGIAINPKNGEILSLISFPSFDNNEPAIYLNATHQPLFNRAVSGVYSPGSAIKPLMALAALEEGVVTPINEFFSAGYLEIPNPYYPDQPTRFLDWKPHGYVNLYSALAKSSNVYFYTIGGGFENFKGLGINR
ncbi:MAG: penicillin-binding transpeptidase domain-containing protein, partial [Patescibacteria group bacterium]